MAADMAVIEQVLMSGDLEKLSPAERVTYYDTVCTSLALNKFTRPFEYIKLNGKLQLYARKDCTDQLRKRDKISVEIIARDVHEGVFLVTAVATTPDGRRDSSVGAVPIEGLKGEFRANAMMKAETKSKRRVTLSICGLGMLDETEVESIPGARVEHVEPKALPAPAPNGTPKTGQAAADEFAQRLRECRTQLELVEVRKTITAEAMSKAGLNAKQKQWVADIADGLFASLPGAPEPGSYEPEDGEPEPPSVLKRLQGMSK